MRTRTICFQNEDIVYSVYQQFLDLLRQVVSEALIVYLLSLQWNRKLFNFLVSCVKTGAQKFERDVCYLCRGKTLQIESLLLSLRQRHLNVNDVCIDECIDVLFLVSAKCEERYEQPETRSRRQSLYELLFQLHKLCGVAENAEQARLKLRLDLVKLAPRHEANYGQKVR